MCLVNIRQPIEDPLLILKSSKDVFGCDIDSDAVLQALQTDEMPEEDMFTLKEVIERLLTSVVEVIEKQMNEYIDGDLFHLSSSVITQAKSAPVHNMFSEQTCSCRSPVQKVTKFKNWFP